MKYCVFNKSNNDLYKIVENEIDYNNLNIFHPEYIKFEINVEDYLSLKYYKKEAKLINGVPVLTNFTYPKFLNKSQLNFYIDYFKNNIKNFLKNNKNHISFQKWTNFLAQFETFNTETVQYPLEKSLEEHFYDLNLISLNPLELP